MDELKTEILDVEINNNIEQNLEHTSTGSLVNFFDGSENILNQYCLSSSLGRGGEGHVMKFLTNVNENKSPSYVACKIGQLLIRNEDKLKEIYQRTLFEYNMLVELYALYPKCICKPISMIRIMNENHNKIYTYGIIMELGGRTLTSVIKEYLINDPEWLSSDKCIKYMRQAIYEFENLTAVAPKLRNTDVWIDNVLVVEDEISNNFSDIKFIDFSYKNVSYNEKDNDAHYRYNILPLEFYVDLQRMLTKNKRINAVTRKSKKITIFNNITTVSTHYTLRNLYDISNYVKDSSSLQSLAVYKYKLAYITENYEDYLFRAGNENGIHDEAAFIVALKSMIDTWWELEEFPDKPQFSPATYQVFATRILKRVNTEQY